MRERVVVKNSGRLGVGVTDHRDQVLHALYKQMGMQQKAQGIVFSLPVSDVAGLAAPLEEN